jgi:hypothetical protein
MLERAAEKGWEIPLKAFYPYRPPQQKEKKK